MNLVPALASILLLGSFTQAMNLTPEIRTTLVGSAPRKAADSANLANLEQDLGPTDANERLTVSVLLRRPRSDEFSHLVGALESGHQLAHTISKSELASRYGADASDVQLVTQFAQAYALHVDRIDAPARMIELSGTAAQMNTAFGVSLRNYNHPRGRFHSHTSDVQLPIALSDVVKSIVGLDNRVNYVPYIQMVQTRRKPKPTPNPNPTNPDPTNPDPTQPVPPDEATAIKNSFTAPQIAKIYDFPQGNGSGQCIAILELGGGYNETDLQKYFTAISVTEPTVQSVSVDGANNTPTGQADGPDGEVALDIEIAGAIAPAANIFVYFAPQGTDQGFLHAISTAVHDQTNHCSTISISWGGPESKASASFLQQADELFKDAAAAGITVTVASGDDGFTDGLPGNKASTDFPSSSPHVLSCGGTSLKAQGNSITTEVAWNLLSIKKGATGGGVSKKFPVPDFQTGLNVSTMSGGATALTGRGVPDVAANAAPDTGYKMLVDGEGTISGGTSAVAPLYAGLFAVINSNRGSNVGFANTTLYAHPEAFHVITEGNNGLYITSTSGWSAVTGLGSPDGQKIQDAFAQ